MTRNVITISRVLCHQATEYTRGVRFLVVTPIVSRRSLINQRPIAIPEQSESFVRRLRTRLEEGGKNEERNEERERGPRVSFASGTMHASVPLPGTELCN